MRFIRDCRPYFPFGIYGFYSQLLHEAPYFSLSGFPAQSLCFKVDAAISIKRAFAIDFMNVIL
jgi:hypothetical protein